MKRLITLFTVLALSAIVSIGAFLIFNTVQTIQIEKKLSGLPEAELLKADKDNILDTKVITKEDGSKEVKYIYASDVTVPTFVEGDKVEDISKRSFNSYTFVLGKEKDLNDQTKEVEKRQSVFFGGTPFVKRNDDVWFQTENATTTIEAYQLQTERTPLEVAMDMIIQPAFADTTTTWPNANPEQNSFDGYVRNVTSGSWETKVGQTTGTFSDDSSIVIAQNILSTSVLNVWGTLGVIIILFETSLIDDTATITSSTLFVNGNTKTDTLGVLCDTVVVSSTPISNAAISLADLGSVGETLYSSVMTYTNVSNTAYNAFQLNEAGIADIQITTSTKLALRNNNYDRLQISPVFTASSNCNILFDSSDTAGTSQDPYLLIDYTLPSGEVTPPSQESDFFLSEE